MGEHLNQWVEILNSRAGHLVGILSGAMAAVTANMPTRGNIMDRVWFTPDGWEITTQNLLTFLGAGTSLLIVLVTLYKFFRDIRKEVSR